MEYLWFSQFSSLKSAFKVVQGLSGSPDSVSFQSENYQDYYITHEDGLVNIEHIDTGL